MSLKDRLSANKQVSSSEVEKNELEFYENNDSAPAVDSLGIVETLFADDDLNSIFVQGAKNIYSERRGRVNKISLTYRDNVQLENIVRKVAQHHGIKIDNQNPFISFNHRDGINVTVTLPPLSNNIIMVIKCYKDKFSSLTHLGEYQALSKEMSLFIEALCSLKLNIIITGEKNTLKTTLLSAMTKLVPPNDRTILIDYKNEIKIDSSNIANYNFSKLKDAKIKTKLLDSLLYANPDKLIINDIEEDFELYKKIIKSGYKGLMATICAKDNEEVLSKFEDIKNNIDVIISTKKNELGQRIISKISVIEDEIKDIFCLNDVQYEHYSTGITPAFYTKIEQNGLPVSSSIFESNYKHTYYQGTRSEIIELSRKTPNLEVLKKFKKDLSIKTEEQEENSENIENEQEQISSVDENMP